MSEIVGIYDRMIVHLWTGFYYTIYLFLAASALSVIVGFLAGLIKSARVPVIHFLITIYITIIRGTPFLLVIFIIYYVLPFFDIRLSSFTAGVIGLIVHEGAYMTEIVRGGIESIDKGQFEASYALGLNYFQKMRYIVLPQAIKIMLPPFAGQMVLLIKATSIVSLIGLTEVTRVGRQLAQRGENPFLVFILVGAFYFIICYPVINISDRLERRVSRSQNG
jgi:polar amino acid transport system permease protein